MHRYILLVLLFGMFTACSGSAVQATETGFNGVTTTIVASSTSVATDFIETTSTPDAPATPTAVEADPFANTPHANEIILGSYFDGWQAAVDEQNNLLALADASGQLVPTEQGKGVVKKDGLVWVWSNEAGRFEVPTGLQGVAADVVVVMENGDLVVIGESGSPERMIRNGEVIETKDGLLEEDEVISWWNRQKAVWVAVEGVARENIYVTKDYITVTEGDLFEAVSFIDLITGDEYLVPKISIPISTTDSLEASTNYLQINDQSYIWIPYQGRWLRIGGISIEEANVNTINNVANWLNGVLNVDNVRFTRSGEPMEYGWDGENRLYGVYGQAVLLGFLETDRGQVLVLGFEDGSGERYYVYGKARERMAEFSSLWVRKRPWSEDTLSISNANVFVTSGISNDIYSSIIGKPILFFLNKKPIGWDVWDNFPEELYGPNKHLIDILKELKRGSVRGMSNDPMINPVFGDPINLDDLAFIGDIVVWVDTLSE